MAARLPASCLRSAIRGSGIVQSLQLSAGAAVLVAAYALAEQQILSGLMFGYLAYGSYQTLQMYRNHWR